MVDSRDSPRRADSTRGPRAAKAVAALVEHRGHVEYIRTAEAARILGVSAKTVSRWAKAGKIPHVVTLGGHRRFPAAAVHELAREMSDRRD